MSLEAPKEVALELLALGPRAVAMYNAALGACESAVQLSKSQLLAEEMRRLQLQADSITLLALTGTYGRAMRWREAISIHGSPKLLNAVPGTWNLGADIEAQCVSRCEMA